MNSTYIKSAFAAVALLSVATSCNSSRQASPADMKSRIAAATADGKTLIGHHDDPVYGHDWYGDSDRSDILAVAGDYPAMMSWDLGGLELGHTENLDSVPFARMAEEVRRQHERGGFNTFSWHLYSPVDSTDCWTIGDSLTVQKILNDSVVNATFRKQLQSLAAFFNGLKDADGNSIEVIFRPFHEHTGGWFWWGKPYNTPEEYKSLWHIIVDEFDKAGVDNLLYAYSPDRIATEEQYLEYYPGDDMVDILGIDIYLFNGADGLDEYVQTAANALAIVNRLGEERNKLTAFTETGSEGIPLPDWWNTTLLPLLKANPVSYVVLWRNAHDKPGHFYVPYPGHGSATSFAKFCNEPAILLAKDLKNN